MRDAAPTPSAVSSRAPRLAVVAAAATAARLRRSLKTDGLRAFRSVAAVEDLRRQDGAAALDAVVVHLPELAPEAAEGVRALRLVAPNARVVLVAPSMSLRQLRVLLEAGVDAFVLEADAVRTLGPAVRSVCAGSLVFPASLRQTLARPVLTAREKQVLGLVVLGLTNGEIARKLHLSESTVKSHLSSSFSKLGARSRSEATALILDPATGLGTGILTIADEA
jgi:two-component system response regulator DesR